MPLPGIGLSADPSAGYQDPKPLSQASPALDCLIQLMRWKTLHLLMNLIGFELDIQQETFPKMCSENIMDLKY